VTLQIADCESFQVQDIKGVEEEGSGEGVPLVPGCKLSHLPTVASCAKPWLKNEFDVAMGYRKGYLTR